MYNKKIHTIRTIIDNQKTAFKAAFGGLRLVQAPGLSPAKSIADRESLSMNQKTAKNAVFGKLTSSLSLVVNHIVSLAGGDNLSSIGVDNAGTLEVRGIEPPKPWLTARQSDPATPRASLLYQGVCRLSILMFTFSFFFLNLPTAHAGITQGVAPTSGILTASSTGLMGYWTFDGKNMSTTTAIDSSSSKKNGTLTNMSGTPVVQGKIGQALKFDGVNDYVSVGNVLNALTSYTFSAWINPKSLGGGSGGRIIDKNSAYFFRLISSGGNKLAISHNGGPSQASTGTITFNRWQHVVATWNGKQLVFYINGVDAGTISFSTAISSNSAALQIGDTNSGNSTFDGSIDDVRIYNRALSAVEVRRLYNMGAATKINVAPNSGTLSTASSTGLVGYWTFDGKNMSTTTAIDSSSNKNNGTLTNMSGNPVVPGKIGQALKFDGVNDYVNPGTTNFWDSTTPRTVAFWVKTDINGTNLFPTPILMKTDQSTGFIIFFGTGGYGGINFGSNSNFVRQKTIGDISSTLKNGWHHVALVFDGVSRSSNLSYRLYLDGVLQTLGITGDFAAISNTNVIGADNISVPRDNIRGFMDDVRIYNRALSAGEVRRLYNMGAATKINVAPNSGTLSTASSTELTGYWTFDGKNMSTTTAIDLSGHNNPGALIGGVVQARGRMGQALKFDGLTGTVNLGFNLNRKKELTISAWIKTSVLKSSFGNKIVHQGTSVASDYDFNINTTAAKVSAGWALTTVVTGNTSLVANQWYHVAMVRRGSTGGWQATVYVNGLLDGSGNTATDPDGASNIIKTHIGSRNNTASFFNGSIDDVRIYNRALSAGEVRRLYNMGR